MPPSLQIIAALLTIATLCTGCGTIKGRTATDQLLVSDAVDQSIQQIDFGKLSGARVFLDATYLKSVRSVGFVNSEYILSSLRERMVRAHCKLQDRAQDADYIVEVRVGALGTDSHEINYGIPGNQALNQTASMLTSSPIPALPEISFARKDERRAAAKMAIFAYRRESREPVWETGPIQTTSLAKSTWILGAGPFQHGKIYEGNDFGSSPVSPTGEITAPVIAAIKKPWVNLAKRSTTSHPNVELAEADGPIQLLPVPHDSVQTETQLASTPAQQTSAVTQATAIMPIQTRAQRDCEFTRSGDSSPQLETSKVPQGPGLAPG